MQVKAVINEKYEEIEIHVCNQDINRQVKELVEDISGFVNQGLMVQAENGDKTMLSEKDIIGFFSEEQKVYAKTPEAVYLVPKKLYELENELDANRFVRISKSEIINLKQIKRLDMSISGTIRVIMKDDSESYTSRRNVVKLKKALGL